MANTNEDSVNAFFGDSEVQRLVDLTATWQPLQICYPKEFHVSRFLAWLLDPSQGHGLGLMAMKALLIAAGREGIYDDCEVDLRARRYLAPASVMTESFSPSLISTEIDVAVNGQQGQQGRQLDVLCVDSTKEVYVAIENKFGARESEGQLASYRKGLQKMFPDYLGILIFLDSKEVPPTDRSWLAPGYSWLAEFLRGCEQRSSTARHVSECLQQFRQVLQEEDDDLATVSPVDKLVTLVTADHPEVIEMMRPWTALAKSARPRAFRDLIARASTNDGKAEMRLFQIYSQRPTIWRRCLKALEFAVVEQAMRKEFPNVYSEPKQVQIFYSLPEWDRFVEIDDSDSWFYPVCVGVRKIDDKYRVVSFLNLSSVSEVKRNRLVEISRGLQKANNLRGKNIEDPTRVTIKKVDNLTMEEAKVEVVVQMRSLHLAFRGAP